MNWILLLTSLHLGLSPENEASFYYVETGAYATRPELEELATSVEAMGLDVEIGSRESLDGHATWYGFLIGLPDLEAASDVARILASQGGRGVGIYTGDQPAQLSQAPDSGANLMISQGVPYSFESTGVPDISFVDIQEMLRTLHRREVVDLFRQNIIFRFSRVTQSGTSSESGSYQYLRKGDEIVVIGPSGEIEPVAYRHSPEVIFVRYIEVVNALVNPPPYGDVRLQASGTYGRRRALQFVYEDETRSSVIVTSENGRLIFSVEENSSAGKVQYRFNQWREMGYGVAMPFVIEVFWQGDLVETVEVHEATFHPQFSEEYDLYFENP